MELKANMPYSISTPGKGGLWGVASLQVNSMFMRESEKTGEFRGVGEQGHSESKSGTEVE